MKLHTVLVILCLLYNVKCSKILVITSQPAHSHFTLTFRLAKELADRKHQVTFINPFPQKKPIENLHEISIAETIPFVEELRKSFSKFGSLGALGTHLLEYTLGPGITEFTLNNTGVQKLLRSKETFDVVIIEHFLNEAVVGIGHHFSAPVILLAPIPSAFRNNYIFGNPAPSSYIPDIEGTFTKHMCFWQRLTNFLWMNAHDVFRELVMMPKHRELFKKYIKTDLELDDVLYNVSLILTTSHPSVNDAVPHLPNIIEIGGYHVFPPKQLPQHLQEFLDNATEGVILFSMGSNLKSKDLTMEVRKAIMGAFSQIKAKVLWKFEMDLPEAPDNVKIMDWVPQQDVLAHPNVRGFITHGGLLSTIEAVYYGVPLIGIPIFGDQFSNIAAAASNGYAISVPLDKFNEERFLNAINEILHNDKYINNVRQRSKAMHDQPLKPIDSAIFWIEYVIRHKGAPYMRSASSDLRWYQREMVDILTFLSIVALTALIVLYKSFQIIVNLLLGRNKKMRKIVSKNKKNK